MSYYVSIKNEIRISGEEKIRAIAAETEKYTSISLKEIEEDYKNRPTTSMLCEFVEKFCEEIEFLFWSVSQQKENTWIFDGNGMLNYNDENEEIIRILAKYSDEPIILVDHEEKREFMLFFNEETGNVEVDFPIIIWAREAEKKDFFLDKDSMSVLEKIVLNNDQSRRRIFCAQERMYQLEDIQEVIDSKYGEDFEVSDEQMSQILSLYEKYLSNDGDWRICAEDAIRNILF